MKEDTIFLLGAGASKDAGIPTSTEMVDELKANLPSEKPLFDRILKFLIGAISFALGCRNATDAPPINIEDVMRMLRILEKRDEEILYPFVGSWHEKLTEFESIDQDCFTKFREYVDQKLVEWISIDRRKEKIKYLSKFGIMATQFGKPLHIFSLNYDIALEKALDEYQRDIRYETGFGNNDEWNSALFEDEVDKCLFVYKLHGSINWFRDRETMTVFRSEAPTGHQRLMIFGTDVKLQSREPFLYQLYRFGDLAIRAPFIAVVGYSFGDSYINSILFDALQKEENRRLIVAHPDATKMRSQLDKACKRDCGVALPESKVIPVDGTTKGLLENGSLQKRLAELDDEMKGAEPF